jgi:hypothetical protein
LRDGRLRPDKLLGRAARHALIDQDDRAARAYGFMSVPPERVAALSGSEASDLPWLGGMSKQTKAQLHFVSPAAAGPLLNGVSDDSRRPAIQ